MTDPVNDKRGYRRHGHDHDLFVVPQGYFTNSCNARIFRHFFRSNWAFEMSRSSAFTTFTCFYWGTDGPNLDQNSLGNVDLLPALYRRTCRRSWPTARLIHVSDDMLPGILLGYILGDPKVFGGSLRTAKGSIAVPFSFAAYWHSKYVPSALGPAATATGSILSISFS